MFLDASTSKKTFSRKAEILKEKPAQTRQSLHKKAICGTETIFSWQKRKNKHKQFC